MSQENFNILYSNLQTIYNCKNDIKNVLVNKNQNMTNIDFANYSNIITNLNGKVATTKPNIVSGTADNLKNTLTSSQNVIVTYNNGTFSYFGYYNSTSNTISSINMYLNTTPQQVLNGWFIGDGSFLRAGKLDTPYISNTDSPSTDLNVRINSLSDLSSINISNIDTDDVSYLFSNKKDVMYYPFINLNNFNNLSHIFYNSNITCYNYVYFTKHSLNFKSAFENCTDLITIGYFFINGQKESDSFGSIDLSNSFANCTNLKYIKFSEFMNANTYCRGVTNISSMFAHCNNLFDFTICNIIERFILYCDDIPQGKKNLNNSNEYSPFYLTNIASTKYSNYLTNLTEKGWTY